MSLFSKSGGDQLYYRLQFYPAHMLGDFAKDAVEFETRIIYRTKEQLLAGMNSELTHWQANPVSKERRVVWLLNNIPSEQDWERKSESFILSTVCRDFTYNGRQESLLILSFASAYRVKNLNYDSVCLLAK